MCLFNWWCVWWLVYLLTNLWAAKLRHLFSSQDVTEQDNLHADVMNNISPSDLANLDVSPDSVLECIGHLKHGKFDGTSLSSDFLIYAAPVIALVQFFTAILRHGYVPASLRDCLIVSIPKGKKIPLSVIITVLLHLHHLLARPWSGSFSPSLVNVSVLMTCSLALRRVFHFTVHWLC